MNETADQRVDRFLMRATIYDSGMSQESFAQFLGTDHSHLMLMLIGAQTPSTKQSLAVILLRQFLDLLPGVTPQERFDALVRPDENGQSPYARISAEAIK